MKRPLLLLFALLMVSSYGFSQDCSANPGGDQNICLGDQMILYGEDSDLYADPLQAQWTADPSNPIPVTFDDANMLETKVYPDASQGYTAFVGGDYTFELCVVCSGPDAEVACQSVTVFVGEIINPPVIEPVSNPICGGEVTLIGSLPDPGVTTEWLVEDFSGTFNEIGNLFELDHNGLSNCENSIIYQQGIGTCIVRDTIEVIFHKVNSEITAEITTGCPSCTKRIRAQGTNPGCGGQEQWTLVSYPAGVNPSNINIVNPNSNATDIEVPANGLYTFGYSIDNSPCPNGSGYVEVSCEVDEIPDFGLEPGASFISCSTIWDIPFLNFSDPGFPGASYQWSVGYSSITNHGITFSDPNSPSTTAFFNNAPMDVAPAGWNFNIKLTMTLDNCQDSKIYFFKMYPPISIEHETVNLLCGGDPFFDILSNVQNEAGLSAIVATVLSSPSLPVGFQFQATNPVDLSVPGTHCFELDWEISGTDVDTNTPTTCLSTESFCVNVANVPTVDCGSAIETCLLNTQLNGSTPLDENGNPLDIPVYWVQTGGPPVTLIDANSPDPFVKDMEHGNVYTFQYVISDEPDCMISCENTITVLPQESCPPCEFMAQVGECLNGCVTVNLSGADEYEWVPSTGVDVSDPENPVICNTENSTYLVKGIVDGKACSSLILEIPGCEANTTPCAFTLIKDCGFCSCGDPVGGAYLADAEGNYFNVSGTGVDLEWIVDGEIVGEGFSSYSPHYTEPFILCAHVSYMQSGGILCDTTMCVDVVCHGDCPLVSFATCADAPFSDYPECADYDPNSACLPGGFSGYVWAVDQAGNPIDKYDFNFDFAGQGNNNPVYISTWGNGGCGNIPLDISNTIGCDTTYYFDPDCCSQTAPEIDCAGFDKDCWRIDFPEICGTDTYVFEVTCLDNSETTTYELDASEVQYVGSFCVPIPKDCEFFQVSMTAKCISGSEGPASNCVYIDVRQDFCYEGRDPCDGPKARSSAEEKLQQDQSRVYPNPNNDGIFYYQYNFPMTSGAQSLSILIYDISGKLLYNSALANHQGTQEIKATLPVGLYLLKVRDNHGTLMDSKRVMVTGK